MEKYKIVSLINNISLKEKMATWFNSKWGVPKEAYLESMEEAINNPNGFVQWYVVLDDNKIIGGCGVIKNDFHDRKDLFPNVCAVYVEEEYRRQGICKEMLDYCCKDLNKKGYPTLYLVTDHTNLYERYGWQFYCHAQGDGEDHLTRLYIHNEDN